MPEKMDVIGANDWHLVIFAKAETLSSVVLCEDMLSMGDPIMRRPSCRASEQAPNRSQTSVLRLGNLRSTSVLAKIKIITTFSVGYLLGS